MIYDVTIHTGIILSDKDWAQFTKDLTTDIQISANGKESSVVERGLANRPTTYPYMVIVSTTKSRTIEFPKDGGVLSVAEPGTGVPPCIVHLGSFLFVKTYSFVPRKDLEIIAGLGLEPSAVPRVVPRTSGEVYMRDEL